MENKLLVENILKHPEGFSWQMQGLGMLRIYLDGAKKFRLHIWDSALRVPGVSALHNHPWDLKSKVVAGVYKQYRYVPIQTYHTIREEFNRVTIKCGEGAACTSDVEKVLLSRQPLEEYTEGQEYFQQASEIHWSIPEDGTVTLVDRTPKEDADHACVYWRGKGGWVTAEPRLATAEEVKSVTTRALESWF